MMVSDFQGSTELGRLVEERRKEIGLSRAQVAKSMGWSYNMVAKVELGRRMVPMDAIPAFADVLDLSSDVLYAASGMVPPDIQGRLVTATAEQIEAVRQIMT
jgi:transcriptional regulator with XRE-family HTH domain